MAVQLLNTPGKRLRAAREHANLYQADLARQLGVTQSYLSRLENDVEPLRKLAGPAGDVLGVSADFLLMQSDDPFPDATEAALPGAAAMAELEQLLVDAPDELRPGLVRFLVRMVAVYRETVAGE